MLSLTWSYIPLGILVLGAIIYRYIRPPAALKKIPTLSWTQYISYVFKQKQEYTEKFPVDRMLASNSLGVSKLWLTDWMVMLYDPAFARQFIKHPELFTKFESFDQLKGSMFTEFARANIVFSNGEQWRRFRRAINPIFRKPWPPTVFANCANSMILQWNQKGNRFSVEVHDWMQRLTFDVLGQAILAMDFQAVQDENSHLLKTYRLLMDGMMDFTWSLLYFLDRPWNPLRRKYWGALHELDAIISKDIQEKKEKILKNQDETTKKSNKDLLTLMLEANQDPENPTLTDREIMDNLKIFLIAGHDTTATALTAEIYNMAHDQEAQKKARSEILEALGEYEYPTLNTKLPYLDAVIKESLRLYPPVVEYPLRTVADDVTLQSSSGESIFLPKNTIVLLESVMLHRNKLMWDKPNDFCPERWLEKEVSVAEEHDMGYVPFSGGSRICIGMNFSLLEQRVILTMLLREYEWTLPEDTIHKEGLRFYGTKMFTSLPTPITFTKRQKMAS